MLGHSNDNISFIQRCAFTHLIPPGQESEFFGIFEVSDKGSSILGPIVIGVTFQLTGMLRYAVVYLVIIHIAALAVLSVTDFEQGARDCSSLRMAMRLKALKNQREKGRRKKGVMSFLSLNSVSSVVQSAFSSTGASEVLKSQMSELSSMMKGSVSEMDSELASEVSSVIQSELESFAESGMVDEDTVSMVEDMSSTFDDEDEIDLEDETE